MRNDTLPFMVKQDFINRLNGISGNHIPIWFMRQAGRYLPEYRKVRARAGDFLSLCYSPEWASEVTLQPLRRYDLDAAIIFSDILVVPHALGQKLWFVEGEGPRLDPILTISAFDDWNEDSFLDFLSPVFEAVERTRASLSDEKALIGFSGAPWTLACYMINGKGSRDYQNVRLYALQNPEKFSEIIDLLIKSISLYLIKKIDSGVDAVQLFDSWAGVLSAEEFEAYCIQPTKKIIQNVKKHRPNTPIIGFPRGAGYNYNHYIEETGIDCVSCDQSVPLCMIRDFQNKLCVQGNLDNLLLLEGGQAMHDQTEKICQALQNKPFIFNLGHGVIKETNPETVSTLIRTIRNTQRR